MARSPFLRDFARHPVLCDLVHDLIGPDVRLDEPARAEVVAPVLAGGQRVA